MKHSFKIMTTVVAMCTIMAVMMIGIWAATSQTSNVTATLSFTALTNKYLVPVSCVSSFPFASIFFPDFSITAVLISLLFSSFIVYGLKVCGSPYIEPSTSDVKLSALVDK